MKNDDKELKVLKGVHTDNSKPYFEDLGGVDNSNIIGAFCEDALEMIEKKASAAANRLKKALSEI